MLGRGKVIERDSAGAPLRFVGTSMEVTDRRFAADALRASEERYRAIIDSIDDAIVMADSGGRMIGWNPWAEAMFDRRADEAIGHLAGHRCYLEVELRIRARRRLGAGWRRATTPAQPWQGSRPSPARATDARRFRSTCRFRRWMTAVVGCSATAIIRDTTERKLADADLRAAATASDAQQWKACW